MWDIDLDGERRSATLVSSPTPSRTNIRGACATKQDVYQLVDKLCEALGIPDKADPLTGRRPIKDQPQA